MPRHDARSDQQLLDAAGDGDDSAFEALYLRHRDWTVRVALRFGASEADAHDILQDTFSYILRKIPGLVLTGRMTTLLYPVIKNLALARRRKSARQRTDDALAGLPAPPEAVWHRFPTGDDFPSAKPQGHDAPVAAGAPAGRELERAPADPKHSSNLGDLAAVLSVLPDAQRETIILRFVDGLSLEEIATALNIPLGTVKSRLHHAIATLRNDPRTRAYFDQD